MNTTAALRRLALTAVATAITAAPSAAWAIPPVPPPAPVDPGTPVVLDTDAKPSFDWSMPERYDASWDEYTFSTGTYDPDFVNPKQWSVKLDACTSKAVRAITGYLFTITQQGTSWSRTVTSKKCSAQYQLPALGKYAVRLVLTTDWGLNTGVSEPLNKSVTLKDLLVVSIGDSLASGEGNPDKRGDYEIVGEDTPAEWKDSRCHRSALSGPARAAQRLEDADPRTSVTFISVACSGAKIPDLSHRRYGGIAPRGDFTFPAQVDQVASLVGPTSPRNGRAIDALLVSAGVNDLYFSNVIKRCAKFWTGTSCIRWSDRNKNLAGLAASYARLAAEIHEQLPSTGSVLVNNYPRYVFKNGGCGALRGITKAEGTQMAKVGLRLNRAIATAVARYDRSPYRWRAVHDLAGPFKHHPYCGSSTWFTRLEWSLRHQGDVNGTAHPNGPGHRAYATILLQTLAPVLAA